MTSLEDVVYVGFNRYVVALDQKTGKTLWVWKSPKRMSGYVSLLLDRGRLIASVDGYTFALDPRDGKQLWINELKGLGTGPASLVSVNGRASDPSIIQAAASNRQRQSSSHTTPPT